MSRPAFHTALLIVEQTLPPHSCLGSFLERKELICLKLQLHCKVFLEGLQVPAHHRSPILVLKCVSTQACDSKPFSDGWRKGHPPSSVTLPSEVSLNLSLLFFFLHFQGLKILPKLENLLFLFVGGVVSPDSKTSTPMLASPGA